MQLEQHKSTKVTIVPPAGQTLHKENGLYLDSVELYKW